MTWVSATGLLMVVFGECLRKAAMFTAGSNFNHVVQNEKSDTHTLVTSGVYAWCRHPSYVGWFYWSIGTQVLGQLPPHTRAPSRSERVPFTSFRTLLGTRGLPASLTLIWSAPGG